MAILTGAEIARQIRKGRISIDPFSEENLNPNSVDLRLDLASLLVAPPDREFDSARNESDAFQLARVEKREVDGEIRAAALLEPGRLYLASTLERTATARFVPILAGRSSLARLGVSIFRTAGFGDLGFNGRWTIQLTCVNPVWVYDLERIAQVYFLKPVGSRRELYFGKYQNARGVQASRGFLDREFLSDPLDAREVEAR